MPIYFAQNAATGSVRIGWASSVGKQLLSLQAGCEQELLLLCSVTGTSQDASRMRGRFSHLQIRGDWFRGEPELVSFMRAVIDEQLGRCEAVNEISASSQRSQIRVAVLHYLSGLVGGSAFVKDIADATGHKEDSVRKTLGRMQAEGVAKKIGNAWALAGCDSVPPDQGEKP